MHDRRHAQVLDRQHRLAGLAVPARIHFSHAAPEHHFHQVLAIDFGGRPRADQLAVSQHRDRVTNLEHLAETVGDVDDRPAFGLQCTERAENPLDLHVGQRGGRLVQDEHPRVASQHAGDLDKLPLADAELRHRRIERLVAQPHLFERSARAITEFLAAVEQRHLAVAEPDVVEDGERRREAQLLRHQRDAEFLRVQGARDRRWLAVNQDDAAVDLMHAGENLHERALARAILAADGAYLLGVDRQRDVLENLVRAEPFGHPFDSENGLSHRHVEVLSMSSRR